MIARGEIGPGAAADIRVAPDVLDTTDDAELAWRCIERAYEMVSIHDGPAVLDALDDDARDGLFEEFDDRFYALMDGELYPRAAVYVRSHYEEFVR